MTDDGVRQVDYGVYKQEAKSPCYACGYTMDAAAPPPRLSPARRVRPSEERGSRRKPLLLQPRRRSHSVDSQSHPEEPQPRPVDVVQTVGGVL